MRNSSIKVTLLSAGLLAVLMGSIILVAPAWLAAQSGVQLAGQVSLLSETRAPGAALLASGVLIAYGALAAELSVRSALLATVLYLSYGCARLVSLVVDGIPAAPLLGAAAVELLIGLACAFALSSLRRPLQQVELPGLLRE